MRIGRRKPFRYTRERNFWYVDVILHPYLCILNFCMASFVVSTEATKNIYIYAAKNTNFSQTYIRRRWWWYSKCLLNGFTQIRVPTPSYITHIKASRNIHICQAILPFPLSRDLRFFIYSCFFILLFLQVILLKCRSQHMFFLKSLIRLHIIGIFSL